MESECFWIIKEKNDHYIGLCFSSTGLYACTMPFRALEDLKKSIANNYSTEIKENSTTHKHADIIADVIWQSWLGNGFPLPEDISLDFSGFSSKQIRIFRACMQIPRGEGLTYGQLAEKAGFPRAARFVGTTMSQNRFALIVPCHRVVRADGIGPYGDNPELKELLLRREGYVHPKAKKGRVSINII
ncbi:MAG: methylated-DNA--[protein]-cysteine S-methyltransferase [Candidatus Hodarchaeota archaeon]